MKTIEIWLATTVCVLTMASCGRAGESPASTDAPMKVGVYDSRAVAIAFVGSPAHEKRLQSLTEAEGKAQQVLLHKQGFSTAPVDDILENIKDKLPEIARNAGVVAIVSKWDTKKLAKYKSAERVDVTMALVDALQPNERQRKTAVMIQRKKPISLEQAERIKD